MDPGVAAWEAASTQERGLHEANSVECRVGGGCVAPLPGLALELQAAGGGVPACQPGAQLALTCPPRAAGALQLSRPRQVARTPPPGRPPTQFAQHVHPVAAVRLRACVLHVRIKTRELRRECRLKVLPERLVCLPLTCSRARGCWLAVVQMSIDPGPVWHLCDMLKLHLWEMQDTRTGLSCRVA